MKIGNLITLKDYEKVIFILRRSLITFLPSFFFFILMLILPFGLYFVLQDGFDKILNNELLLPILILFSSTYILSVILFFYSYFTDFYLDILLVTNDRLPDVEQKNLFSRTISEVDLYKIQDITSEIKGFFPSIFNYGNIIIQTAGTVPRFTIHNVNDPHGLRQQLLDMAADDRHYHDGHYETPIETA